MRSRKIHRCPPDVAFKEIELYPPPPILAAITEGKIVQEIPEYANKETSKLPEAVLINETISMENIESKRKRLEVREWRAQVSVLNIAGDLGYDCAVACLANECRRMFARYRCIFLGRAALKIKIGRDKTTFTLLVKAAVEQK